MSALDDVISTISASQKIDPSQKAILLEFLQAGAPILNSLEASALQGLMQWLAGDSVSAPAAIDSLDAGQVSALLDVTQKEMDAAVQERKGQVAAMRAAVSGLADKALAMVAQLLISAL